MRTPEEIKKGLECCKNDKCADCRYFDGNGYWSCVGRLIDDIFAYVQQLEAHQPRWISVKDREPEHDGLYYCHTAIWGDIMCRYANGRWVDDRAKFMNFPRRPTHWLEILDIPHPLEEENENVT